MTSLGMEVAGMCTQSHLNMINTISYVGQCTNGEWNSLRCKGNTTPLSVLQIRADSRRKYANMSQLTLIKILTPIGEYKKHYDYPPSIHIMLPYRTP